MKSIEKLRELIEKNIKDKNIKNEMINDLSSIHCHIRDLEIKIDRMNQDKERKAMLFAMLQKECNMYKNMLRGVIDEQRYSEYDY